MRNKNRSPGLYEKDLEPRRDLYLGPYKTTNVNILLNRVRLDKKKSIRKKMIIAAIFLLVASGLIFNLLI